MSEVPGSLEKNLHAQASNECPIARKIAETWFDKLHIWCDTQPRKGSEIVKQFPPISVTGAKRRICKRTEFVAGTRIEPAQAKGIALLPTERTISADTQTDEPSDRRGIAVTE